MGPPPHLKDAFKIYIGNIITSDPVAARPLLKEKFAAFGPVLECDILHQYGFCHMKNKEDADEAVKHLNGTTFENGQINVQHSTARKNRRVEPTDSYRSTATGDGHDSVKIFVGNIQGKDAKAEDLRALFEGYGKVYECDLMNEFGFVHVAGMEAASEAVKNLNGHKFFGYNLRVAFSNKKSKLEMLRRPGAPDKGASGPSADPYYHGDGDRFAAAGPRGGRGGSQISVIRAQGASRPYAGAASYGAVPAEGAYYAGAEGGYHGDRYHGYGQEAYGAVGDPFGAGEEYYRARARASASAAYGARAAPYPPASAVGAARSAARYRDPYDASGVPMTTVSYPMAARDVPAPVSDPYGVAPAVTDPYALHAMDSAAADAYAKAQNYAKLAASAAEKAAEAANAFREAQAIEQGAGVSRPPPEYYNRRVNQDPYGPI